MHLQFGPAGRDGRGGICRLCALAAVGLLTSGALAFGSEPVSVQVLENSATRIVLEYDFAGFTTRPVLIAGKKYEEIALGSESLLKQAGAPALPNVCRSVVIPDDAEMALNVLASEHYDLTDIDVPPSKGFILRTVNPADVPYSFGPAYEANAFFPAEPAGLREPYILRDHRGIVVEINPFQYNPVQRTLRVYRNMTVELVSVGPGQVNVLHREQPPTDLSLAFDTIYQHHFVNYQSPLRYTPLDETGDLLIICYDAWLANVQPLVAHRNSRGINTTAVGVSTIGNNSTSIKNYIQSVYNTSDLAFVLLVGDYLQVATPSASGGAADPTYALVAGGDSYPDILVGRFSAETPAHVDTQVQRTIEYELMPANAQDWFMRGTGIASNQGPGDDGEYDYQHVDNIRVDLLGYGYTVVDQIYDPTGTAAQVSNALNAGRGIINYTGHGSTTSWSSTGFSNTDVNALINDNMLPFIFSVACVNGEFDGYTCFGEAWLRATHGTEPTGAIGAYMSSINQSWDPPMCAQDEFVDLLVAEAYVSFGALCFAGSCQMIDEYGSGGVEMFNTWHIFGDPSLQILVFGPFAPETQNLDVETDQNTFTDIALMGTDGDGDPLDFIIISLPDCGSLEDPNMGPILSVPYTLAGRGHTVRYTPDADYLGYDSFAYRANDGGTPPGGGDSNLSTVSILVMAEPPSITTTTLPEAMHGMPYDPMQVTATGGQPEVVWSLATELAYVEDDLGASGFAETGVGQGWNGDDAVYNYTLPFNFPFYEVNYNSVKVSCNGFLNFGSIIGSTASNSLTLLKQNKRIAVLWDDLKTYAPNDIFVDTSVAGEVTIRWKAVTYVGAYSVNAAITLSDDGKIRFHYGSGNTGLTPTIGISAGDEVHYAVASYNGASTLTDADSLELKLPNGMPEGMTLDASGMLWGTPLESGDFEPVVRVTDSLGRTDQRLLPLHVAQFVAGDYDADDDGDVDLVDFGAFQACFTGDGQGPAAGGCETFYSDPDADVDLTDLEAFCAVLSTGGPNGS